MKTFQVKDVGLNPIVLLFLVAFLGVLAVPILLSIPINNVGDQSQLTTTPLPQNTKVILHASTFSSSGQISSNPRSIFYFYDSTGKYISSSGKREEVNDDCILQTDDRILYLFKNETISSSNESVQNLPGRSGTEIKSVKFGPSTVGYIEELDLGYSLLNVGKKSPETPYVTILRFISDDEFYDVIIPYYLNGIAYDASNKRFVCEISSLTPSDVVSFLDYTVVAYSAASQQFEWLPETYHLDNPSVAAGRTQLLSTSLVKNNCLYNVRNMQDNNNPSNGDLVLSVYDLEKNSVVGNQYLIQNYALGPYGGVLVGSDQLPFVEKNEQLYVFASTGQVFIISDQQNIAVRYLNDSFEDTVPISNPIYEGSYRRTHFLGAEIQVADDGEIYLLNAYRDGYLRIHQLQMDSTYKLFWEASLPENWSKDMRINTFEIVD